MRCFPKQYVNQLVLLAFSGFALITYFPGLLFYIPFQENFERYYTYSGAPFVPLVFTLMFTVLLSMFLHFVLQKVPHIKVRFLSKELAVSIFLIISFIYFILGLYFFLNYDISFRHRQRLSESGPLIIVLFFLRYFALFYLLWFLAVVLKGIKQNIKMKVTLFLFTLGWALALNGSFQIFYLFFSILLLISPNIYISMKVKQILLFFLLCPLALVLVILVGVANKVGFELLFSAEGKSFMSNYIGTVVARSSTSLYSLAYSFENFFSDLNLAFELVSYEVFTFTNRLALLGIVDTFDSKAIYTVSRFNYLVAFENQADRGGSTPGILASIYYAGGLPLGFMVISFYISIIFRRLQVIFSGIGKFSIVSIFALIYLCIPFFENPISFFNIVQPPVLYLVLTLILSRFIKELSYSDKSVNHNSHL